jgi:hypothetical protein
VRFAVAGAGTEAFEAGAGAEARVRPGPSKPSLACLPQRLPMEVGGGGGGRWVELRGAGRRVRVAVRANWAKAESGGEGAVQPRSGGGLCRGAWRIEGAKDNMAGGG